ncbi:Holliday junction resolvase [Sulfolobales Mexican rudivirus 1]|uniref:Holliday junction resolvase n=1 Tax=Sulfolobales Mexican rod-shaped virus 1 TaxID=2848122 RepID=K4NX80_9VIRU|nr:Holliday junction resolvase [Sulfolobales Mexican rudivirus 1]AFV51246.1 putative Holliday junction resolvase [Sulfolobales Mexican rod-shaped virus 1]
MTNIHASGKYYEYRALNYLTKHGFKAIRVPVSGAGKQPLPDIIATRSNIVYAIEVKSTSKNSITVDRDQIEKLFAFCDVFSFCRCQPAILVFFKSSREIRFVELSRDQREHSVRVSSTKFINERGSK